jgi:hypothetical protein
MEGRRPMTDAARRKKSQQKNHPRPDRVAVLTGVGDDALTAYCDSIRRNDPLTTRMYLRILGDIAHIVAYRIAHPCQCGTVNLTDGPTQCAACRALADSARYRARLADRARRARLARRARNG